MARIKIVCSVVSFNALIYTDLNHPLYCLKLFGDFTTLGCLNNFMFTIFELYELLFFLRRKRCTKKLFY